MINVSGDNIDFHTGWRFWWDKTDIGGGFSKAETDEVRKLYSSVAQKIMWNFKDAKNVTIRGGVANESNSEIDGNYKSRTPLMILRPQCSAASSCRTAASNHT